MAPLLVLCALVLGTVLLPDGLPTAGFWWDFLIASGFCSLAIIAFLGWDSETPASNPRLRLHRNLGILASTLLVVHSIGYLLIDSTVIEYLLPSAPGYMLAGLGALLSLLVVTISSFPGPRKKFYGHFARFRSWHRALFSIILVGSLWHVAGTDFSLDSRWQLAVVGLLLAALPGAAYLSRRAGRPLPLSQPPATTLAADLSTAIAGLLMLVLSAGFAAVKVFACDPC